MSLMKAIETNDVARVKELIASEADVNRKDKEDLDYLLSRAAELGHLEIVKVLVEAEPSVQGYGSALKDATWHNRPEVVKFLVESAGFDGDRLSDYTEALDIAAMLGRMEIIRIFLDAGVDIDAIVGRAGTLLHRAAERGQIPLVEFLLESGAAIDARNTNPDNYYERQWIPLMFAISENQIPIFQLLLDAGADINVCDTQGRTPLLLAIENGRQSMSERLIEMGANLELADKEGCTALILAALEGHKTLTERLIAAGANLNARDRKGNNALTYVEQKRYQLPDLDRPSPESATEAVEETVENLNVFEKCKRFDELKTQQKFQRQEQIAKILRQAGAEESGLKELASIQAAERGKLGIVEALLDTGANPNYIAPDGKIALICAAEKGDGEIVWALLTAGANPNLRSYRSRTALIAAAEKGHLEIVRMLLEAGADPNLGEGETEEWEGHQAIDRAQRNGHWEVVRVLREMGGKRRRKVPLETQRGLVSTDLNSHMILVRASVEAVAEAWASIRNTSIWERDVFEQEVELTNCCFRVFQFTGHPWTIVCGENIWSYREYLKTEEAAQLSQILQTQAIDYGVSDTAGAYGYDFFESGKLMERFDCCDEIEFESQLRQVALDKFNGVDEFMDAFMRSQDAYVPAFRSGLGYCGTGKRVRLAIVGLDPEDLRMDYVAVK